MSIQKIKSNLFPHFFSFCTVNKNFKRTTYRYKQMERYFRVSKLIEESKNVFVLTFRNSFFFYIFFFNVNNFWQVHSHSILRFISYYRSNKTISAYNRNIHNRLSFQNFIWSMERTLMRSV